MRITPALPLIVAAALGLAACGSTEAAQATPEAASPAASASAPPTPGAALRREMPAGAYLSQADYTKDATARAGTKVVYFFHATWCPDCKATDASLTSGRRPRRPHRWSRSTTTPRPDLRKTYGITQQHTFVQVGPDGAALAKWTGTRTGEAIKAKTL